MSTKINIPSYLQQFTGDAEIIEVDANTIQESLDILISMFPDVKPKIFDKEGKLLDYVCLYYNGEFAYGDGLMTPIKDGDEYFILYVIGGG